MSLIGKKLFIDAQRDSIDQLMNDFESKNQVEIFSREIIDHESRKNINCFCGKIHEKPQTDILISFDLFGDFN